MSFIIRTLARTVISTAVSAAVTYGVKKVVENRNARKRAVPRLTDQRKPAKRAKAPVEEAAE